MARSDRKLPGRGQLPSATPARTAAPRALKSYKVLDHLGQRIVSGELVPGALLPTEAELSQRLRLSRASLREALRALALKGLLEARTRRGTLVTDRRHWNVLDADVLRWLAIAPPDPAFYMDLLDVRMIIEPASARLAASRASPEQIVFIEAALRGMYESASTDVEACCHHDVSLHERIILATGNPILIRFAVTIRTALVASMRLSSNARESYESSLDEHQAVVVAIRRRAPDEAEAAMRSLLAGTARDLAPAYDKYPRGIPPPRAKPRRMTARKS